MPGHLLPTREDHRVQRAQGPPRDCSANQQPSSELWFRTAVSLCSLLMREAEQQT